MAFCISLDSSGYVVLNSLRTAMYLFFLFRYSGFWLACSFMNNTQYLQLNIVPLFFKNLYHTWNLLFSHFQSFVLHEFTNHSHVSSHHTQAIACHHFLSATGITVFSSHAESSSHVFLLPCMTHTIGFQLYKYLFIFSIPLSVLSKSVVAYPSNLASSQFSSMNTPSFNAVLTAFST